MRKKFNSYTESENLLTSHRDLQAVEKKKGKPLNKKR